MKLFPCFLLLALMLEPGVQGQSLPVPHDIRSLAGDTGARSVPAALPLARALRAPSDEWNQSLNGHTNSWETVETQSIVEFLLDSGPMQVWEEEGIRREVADGILWITGPQSLQERVDRLLRPVLDRRQRTLKATLRSLADIDESAIPGIVLPRSDAEALGDKAAITTSVDLRTGRITRLAAQRTRALIVDYDVEVAEKTAIADPTVIAFPEGVEMDVTVRLAPRGRLFIEWTTRASLSEGPPPSIDTPYGRLSLPRCRSQVTAGSALISNGGGVVLGSRAAGGPWLLTVSGPPLQGPGIELGPLVTPNRRIGLPVDVGVLPSSAHHETPDSEPESASLIDVDNFIESLRDEDTDMMAWDDALWLNDDEERLAAGREYVAGLVRRLSKTVGVEVRWGLMSPSDVSADASDLAENLDHVGRICGRLGDDLLLVAGREQCYVKDYDVEIASASRIGDVVVTTLFSGLGLRLRIEETGTDRAFLSGDLSFQLVEEADRMFPSVQANMGSIQTPRSRAVTANPRAAISTGAWQVLHVGSLGPGAPAFVAVVRVGFWAPTCHFSARGRALHHVGRDHEPLGRHRRPKPPRRAVAKIRSQLVLVLQRRALAGRMPHLPRDGAAHPPPPRSPSPEARHPTRGEETLRQTLPSLPRAGPSHLGAGAFVCGARGARSFRPRPSNPSGKRPPLPVSVEGDVTSRSRSRSARTTWRSRETCPGS